MAINNTQSQSLIVANLNLRNNRDSHGQFICCKLYVAFSRVEIPKNIYVYTSIEKTQKNVYPLELK